MQILRDKPTKSLLYKAEILISLLAIGASVNIIGSYITTMFGLPLYLDCIGTIFAASVGGYMPGIMIGLISPAINSIMTDPTALSYGMLNVLMAVFTSWAVDRGWFKKLHTVIFSILIYAFIGGVLGSILTWFLYGFAQEPRTADLVAVIHHIGILSPFASELIADYLIDIVDKAISVLVVLVVLKLIPEDKQRAFRLHTWAQAPLTREALKELKKRHSRKMSLKFKVTLVLTLAAMLIATMAISISYILYKDATVSQQKELGLGTARLVAEAIRGDDVDRYLADGKTATGYAIVEKRLIDIRNSSPGIEYIYVYQIKEDGCHVVFDLDTEGVAGSPPGTVIEFDEGFSEYLPALLAGESIEPIITDDKYGWLLTVYEPIKNFAGETVAYAAADISMNSLRSRMHSFLAQEISLFMGVFVFILAAGIYLAEYQMVIPINTMSYVAKSFTEDSEQSFEELVELFGRLNIRTGDEVENLYRSFMKMTDDNLRFANDIKEKNKTISDMQAALIMVLADMVESRDENTGDHVKKTAEYTRIIMDALKLEGIYTDELTDKFVDDVYRSAPLHDIGKIGVSDAILNKPGKLTDEEFDKMKQHTAIGAKIIDQVMETMPEADDGPDYLHEARNLALYHHEKWNGAGYPTGASGEEIPLSARIMAVADVFDALVSRRSYKAGMPFEKAMDIIRESSGTHFDPNVARAFLDAEDEVRRVAESYDRRNEA